MSSMHLAGCRDCTLCTGNAFTGAGRQMGRGLADTVTLGLTKALRNKCQACGHPMAEHHPVPQQVVMQQPEYPQAPPQMPPGWYPSPDDNRARCWWDGYRWHPQTKHYPR